MEHSANCQVEEVQEPPGDDAVSRMSVITLESTSPPESVHSIDSSADEMDAYMVDVDVDVEEAASNESDAADVKLPVLDVVTQDTSVEASICESSENLCDSADITGNDVTGDVDQSESLLSKTHSALENAEENSVHVNNMPHFPIGGSLDKCNDGMEMASETNSILETRKILELSKLY